MSRTKATDVDAHRRAKAAVAGRIADLHRKLKGYGVAVFDPGGVARQFHLTREQAQTILRAHNREVQHGS